MSTQTTVRPTLAELKGAKEHTFPEGTVAVPGSFFHVLFATFAVMFAFMGGALLVVEPVAALAPLGGGVLLGALALFLRRSETSRDAAFAADVAASNEAWTKTRERAVRDAETVYGVSGLNPELLSFKEGEASEVAVRRGDEDLIVRVVFPGQDRPLTLMKGTEELPPA